MSKKFIKVPIKGMHCRSCEILIEEKIMAVDCVCSVSTDHIKGEAIIHHEHDKIPNSDHIASAISEAGYEIGTNEKLPIMATDSTEYTSLFTATFIVLIAYYLFRTLGISNGFVTDDLSSGNLWLPLLLGLTAGISTCMALVGGLTLSLSAKFAENHPYSTKMEKFRPHLFFITGRIVSYTILGGLLGLLGTEITISPTINGLITLAIGGLMLLLGTQLTGIFPRLNSLKLTLPKGLSKAFKINEGNREYSHSHAFALGTLTFFLPCGFTQAVQLYSISTGSFTIGALSMGLFALGTAPGLLGIGGLTSVVSGEVKKFFFKFAGVAVILFGIFNISSGYALSGINLIPSSKQYPSTDSVGSITTENGVQIINTVYTSDQYLQPSTFYVKSGEKVQLTIDVRDNGVGCGRVITIPGLYDGIKPLNAGNDITFEFTPTRPGTYDIVCGMGMIYFGSIVVE